MVSRAFVSLHVYYAPLPSPSPLAQHVGECVTDADCRALDANATCHLPVPGDEAGALSECQCSRYYLGPLCRSKGLNDRNR